ncbi:MAG: DUF2851 family protein [Rikenellaceae bacterium]|nr:DUF2851 family protein [Rikenellaceae bacterium]
MPTLVLPLAAVEKRYDELLAGAAGAGCGEYLAGLNPAVRLGILNGLMLERLEGKLGDLMKIHRESASDWNVTLYTMIFRAMGGSSNKESFTRLARAVPFLAMSHERGSIVSLEALLLGGAGLLYGYDDDPYIRRLNGEFDLLKRKYNIQPLRAAVWQTSGYPIGSPTLRLAELASFFANREFILGKVLECRRCDDLYTIFRTSASDFWSTHYSPESRSAARSKTIGADKAQSLGMNLVVPLMFAYGKQTGDERLQERALSLLESIPYERNSIVRRWQGRGAPIDNAFDSQAILQLNNSYCTPGRCAECRVGRRRLSENL